MRVTNQMMTNSALLQVNKNMNNMSKLEQQYNSQKKIQLPSDDPIIAVRALKFRTNLSELNQYLEKNIPDATNWMSVTEEALGSITSVIQEIAGNLCVQGAQDTLSAENRNSIATTLKEYRTIIAQEGNGNFAGRYVFTGYKTDTSLSYTADDDTKEYEITENFSFKDLENKSVVTGSFDVKDALNNSTLDIKQEEVKRLRLSYDKNMAGEKPSITVDGTDIAADKIVTKTLAEADCYQPGEDEVFYIAETGELILGANVYEQMKTADSIDVTYKKDSFEKDDLRPEHYFNCTATDKASGDAITYKVSDQDIQYEVNYNQKIPVNVQGKDCITHAILRDIDELAKVVDDVIQVEDKIAEVKKLMADPNYQDKTSQDNLKISLEAYELEHSIRTDIMQKAFGANITKFKGHQEAISHETSDLGSRGKRLALINERLSSQATDVEELLSKNEDADLLDVAIRYQAAEYVYNASLQVTAQIMKQSLLDFLQ